jgi:ATP-dependent DNA helicase RecG
MHRSDAVLTLPGVGEKKAQALEKLGLRTLGDLMEYFPRSYEDRRQVWPIRHAPGEGNVCICAVVATPPTTSRIRAGLSITRTTGFDDSGSVTLTFFNQPFVARQLQVGKSYVFWGHLECSNGRYAMTNPSFELEGAQRVTGRIVPVYPLTAGISNRQLAGWIELVLSQCQDLLEDELPTPLRMEHQLPTRDWAVRTVHAPPDFEALEQAKRRLVFEELFYLNAGLALLHLRRQAGAGCRCAARAPEEFYRLLPFQMTGAQRRTLEEIYGDLTSGRRMNRLVQGDVGSGKTAVAAGAIYLAAQSGWQSALMAPTEILAQQHFETMTQLLSGTGLRVGLLTGGMKAAQARQVRKALAAGELDLVVGTHALFSKDVAFAHLGLVVTDEQHRFGVAQRAALAAKGSGETSPHVLVMSATPIPRTLALIIYGDLEVSIIDERPPGRQEVDTFLIGEDKRARLEGFMRGQVEAGHQVFVVCPAVEESPEGAAELKNVTAHAQELQNKVFPDLRVGLVHGKMKPKDKEAAMSAFVRGEIDVLVATTVIEVGVDVPNATLMVIEDAHRFGLSQLHQLRGRVGRGKDKAYCILLSDNRNPDTRKRLKALCATNDGFQIAEQDLQQRGPGDFFGSRQHGLPQLQVADLAGDTRVLYEAREAAQALLQADPALEQPEHRAVLSHIRRLFAENPDIFN